MDFATELRYTTNLDSGVQMTPLKNSFLSGDQDAHRFIVSCFRSSSRQPVDLTGAGVTGYFIRADQSTVVIDGKVEDNCAVLTLPAACYAKEGRFSLVIKASMGEVIHTILWVEGAVSVSHTSTIIDPGEVVPTLDELLAQIAAMEQATAAATTATETANAAAAQAVEIATAKGNEALQNVADAVTAQNETIGQLTEDIGEIATELDAKLLTKAPAIECEASGPLVTVTDAAAQPAVQLVTHIEPVQEGEGDPSPDNVRLIRGWDKVRAMRANRNLLRYPYAYSGSRTVNGVVFTLNGDGTITANGTATALAQFAIIHTNETQRIPAGLYAISGCPEGGSGSGYYIKLGIVGEGERKEVGSGVTFDLNKPARIYMYCSIESGTTVDNITFAPMLRKVDGESGYEPTRTQTLTADLPETVYGGTLDWGTGVLTVDMHPIVYDGSDDERWGYDGTVFFQHGSYMPVGYKKYGKVISTHYVNDTSTAQHIRLGDSYGITVRDVNISSLEDFLSALNTSPMTAAYELAEPYTIQLTPQQLSMLRGTNNLWSDTGDTDLVYVADTKMYIDGKFAELEAAILSQGANV